ncbi:probable LRR receptor-like serine/threonine-protein kinase At3g47570 [Durio zibethinus]|uniref:Probable LRR receptor-like serine/threonine-protein kinase At3g47570 n=1 Tax=Durio zibethinus TaxID=66656 RepID=A0A6P5Z588_DURZI|nr:probable LRR receptor-like serine/threonine-protein kinase At3g47570 [Durio zibethinus]
MANNSISGEIPSNLSGCSKLTIVFMKRNQLTGEIPGFLGLLSNLEVLSLATNSLTGSIPPSPGNLSSLKKLFLAKNGLSGAIPKALGQLTNLASFSVVIKGFDIGANKIQVLQNNKIWGRIPDAIGNLINLEVLAASGNQLSDLSSNYLTGVLLIAVENPKNLGELYVSQNKLFDLLPNNLGSCMRLEKLFLDGNLFEGPIALSLGSLRGLMELDLSNNNLSGEVPKFLASFGSLQYLNLSFNDFEGMIPIEGVFKNATAAFVEGNNKLCGGIPELHLSKCNTKTSIKRSNTSLKLKIAIGFVILGVTLVFSFLLILRFRKKKEQPTATCAENSLLQLSYQSILRAATRFSLQNLVGSGSFGSVYKGILEESGVVIAIKVLNLLTHGAFRSFLVECEALRNIRHRNLVKVLTAISGVDYQGNDFKALVYEFMVNGSLEDWLHPSIDMNEQETMRNLNFFQRVNVAADVGHALESLRHHCDTPIIHCDLKPSNILIDEEMVGHISDFGLAKILSADRFNNYTTQSSSLGLKLLVMLHQRLYIFPGISSAIIAIIYIICDEFIAEYGMGSELSTKGDVYSYGILVLEMFTGKRPTNKMFKEGFNLHNFVVAALPE